MFSGVFYYHTLVIIVFFAFCMWKVFEKAGQEGWKAIIPIYNVYVLTQIIGKPVVMVAPDVYSYIGAIWGIWATNLLEQSFGKSEEFTVTWYYCLSCFIYPGVRPYHRVQRTGRRSHPF